MGLQSKIQELLEEKTVPVSNSGDSDFPKQGNSKEKIEKLETGEYNQKPSVLTKKDTSIQATQKAEADDFPKQGDSKKEVKQAKEGDEDAGIIAQSALEKDNSIQPSQKAESDDFPKQGDSKSSVPYQVKKFTKEELDTDIKAIFGESVEEEIKDKASNIFEAAVIARVNLAADEIVESLEEQYTGKLEEELSVIEEKINKYMSYLADEFMTKNAVAIETGLRESIISDFITGLHDLFEQHYIEVPEGKQNVIDQLVEENAKLKSEMNNILNENIELKAGNHESNQKEIIEDVCEGMTALDKEKFAKLINGIDFVTEEKYREKLNVIKESHFKPASGTTQKPSIELDYGNGVHYINENINEYAKIISKSFGKK